MFTVMTCARSGETLGMTFDEIDFPNAVWRVPKERMKMREPHEVPLSDAAIAILRAQEALRGSNPFVFPGRPQRPLSSMAMAALMKRMGVAATVHGFRSSFRMWAGDTGVDFETAERALAHTVGNKSSQSYNRTTLLERRRPVMNDWANYVCGETGDSVVPLRAALS